MPEKRPDQHARDRSEDTTPGVFQDWTRIQQESTDPGKRDDLKGWSDTELDRLPVYTGGSFYRKKEEQTPALRSRPRATAERTDSLDTIHPQLVAGEESEGSSLTTGAMLIEAALGVIEARQDSLTKRNIVQIVCALILFFFSLWIMYVAFHAWNSRDPRAGEPEVLKEAPVDRRAEEF